MPWHQIGASQYLAQLRLPDEGHKVNLYKCIKKKILNQFAFTDFFICESNQEISNL